MLYLGIDQHAKQLTISLLDETGDMRLRRQASTQAKRCAKFLTKHNKKAAKGDGDIAIVEVCGFNAWLLVILLSIGCAKTVLAQPTKKLKVKTDRRLSEGIVTRSRWDPTKECIEVQSQTKRTICN
ncbi:hypothetical protein [Rhodopirellula baltica]